MTPDVPRAWAGIAGAPPSLPIGRLVLVGHPVAHSLSPRFQNAALAALDAERGAGAPGLVYEALDVAPAALDEVLATLIAARGAGNVTVPHKEAVAARCTRLSPLAARVGAVNTFWCAEDGSLVGDNTDVGGFVRAARTLLPGEPLDLEVALIGAGGSAAAVLAAIERWPGCTVRLWSRRPERAAALATRFGAFVRAEPSLARCVRNARLVVNATPLGLRPDDPLPIPPDRLKAGITVLDLAYHPDETPLVRRCRAAGLRAGDGLVMLIEQGALAFERWFGVAPDRARMWAALDLPPTRGVAAPAG